jgi:Spy/CpxP family protein refolding chaperone
MRRLITVVLMCGASVLALAQVSSSQWQRGTITDVTAHVDSAGERAGDVAQYDVTVKVGNTIYVVLYVPPSGANTVEYSRGVDLLVLVGSDTLTFNSKLSGTTKVPILHKQVLSAESGPDLSKVPGQYFSLKLQNLSQSLNLSQEQQSKIRPILEQETAEVGQVWANPVLSRDDKLNRWRKIVGSSDKQMKVFLSPNQVQKLQEIRAEEKKQLKQVNADQKQKQPQLR